MPEVPEVNIALKSWQKSGAAPLLLVMDHFGGAFLCDPVGAGKTLTALVAAITKRTQLGKENSGFILVICGKGIVHQWKEEAERFTGVSSLSALRYSPYIS